MGNRGLTQNVPSANEKTYRFTRNPQEEMGTKEEQPFADAVGLAINGVAIFGAGDTRSYNSTDNENNPMGDGLWNSDAWVSESTSLDAGGAGPFRKLLENYHYHATPFALYSGTGHSPIIGYAFDGFPIYGPYGYDDPFDAGSGSVRMEKLDMKLRSIN